VNMPKKMNGPTWEAVLSFGDESRIYVGIDEVGRGAWAGPVVAAAVILPFGLIIEGVNDSKKLSPAKRRAIDRLIRRHAVSIGIGWVHASEVDAIGLAAAVTLSGVRAVEALDRSYHLILLDGSDNYLGKTHRSVALVKADGLLPPVAAASIIAKVAHDRYLERMDVLYPHHNFSAHKGYGTAIHSKALEDHGVTKYHRLSYKPLKKYRYVD
jgi:ribonuclease HII